VGRSHIPAGPKTHPSGPRWSAFRLSLIRSWGPSPVCWFCGHGFAAVPQLVQVEHRISPLLRPDLAWSRYLDDGQDPQLVPAHGAGRYRCPDPPDGCGIACNWVSHNAPDAPRDKNKNGASLPFTPEFMARQMELRRRFLAKSGGTKGQSAKAPVASPSPFQAQSGRPW
jgi:hypothetical protein